MNRPRSQILFLILAASMIGKDAWGCSVCFGDPDSTLTMGLHMGVLTLLLIVLLVLGGFARFFWYLVKRSQSGQPI